MGNCSIKPEDICSNNVCVDNVFSNNVCSNNVWYLEGYYTETGEPIFPEPLEPEYVPRKPEYVRKPHVPGKIFCKDSDFSDIDKPSLTPKFKGKLAPLKLF